MGKENKGRARPSKEYALLGNNAAKVETCVRVRREVADARGDGEKRIVQPPGAHPRKQ